MKEDILQICRQKGESFKDCLLDTIGVQESTSDTKIQVFLKTDKKNYSVLNTTCNVEKKKCTKDTEFISAFI